MTGKSVVERPVSLPSTTFRPVTPSPAFHPSISSLGSCDGLEKSHKAAGATDVRLGEPSILAVSKMSTSRTALTWRERLQAVSSRNAAVNTYRFIGQSLT